MLGWTSSLLSAPRQSHGYTRGQGTTAVEGGAIYDVLEGLGVVWGG